VLKAPPASCRLPPAGEVVEGDMYAVIPFDDHYCAVTGLPGDVLARFKSFMWAHPYGTNGACGNGTLDIGRMAWCHKLVLDRQIKAL
jgi:hypothetical protein